MRAARERDQRDTRDPVRRHGTAETLRLFHAERFLRDSAFRPDTSHPFANHHESHALAALFYTDWDDALVYTSDGIGDNVSYSMRALKDGRLDPHYGDDRWLTADAEGDRPRQRLRLCDGRVRFQDAAARGQADRAGGLWRADARRRIWRRLPLQREDGLIETDFRNWAAMREKFMAICQGHDRETIAASIQKLAEDFTLQSVRLVARPQRRAQAGARRRPVRQCPAQPPAGREAAARRDFRLPGDGR